MTITDLQRGFCPRSGCDQVPAIDHEFCTECLAYMREDTDVDPVIARSEIRRQGGPAYND